MNEVKRVCRGCYSGGFNSFILSASYDLGPESVKSNGNRPAQGTAYLRFRRSVTVVKNVVNICIH